MNSLRPLILITPAYSYYARLFLLRPLILITPAYSYYALYYAPVVMDMFTYFVS
jgi:hypothetical protein